MQFVKMASNLMINFLKEKLLLKQHFLTSNSLSVPARASQSVVAQVILPWGLFAGTPFPLARNKLYDSGSTYQQHFYRKKVDEDETFISFA